MATPSFLGPLLRLIHRYRKCLPLESVVSPDEVPFFLEVIRNAARAEINTLPTVHQQPACEPNRAPPRIEPSSKPIQRKRKRRKLAPYENVWGASPEETHENPSRKKGQWKMLDVNKAEELNISLLRHKITIHTLDLDFSPNGPTEDTPLARARQRMEQARLVIVGNTTYEYQRSIRLFAFLSYVLVLWRTESMLSEEVCDLLLQAGCEGGAPYHHRILTSVERFHQLVIRELHKQHWPLSQATLIIASVAPRRASQYYGITVEQVEEAYSFLLRIGKNWESGRGMAFPGDESLAELIKRWEPTLGDQEIRNVLGYPERNTTNGNESDMHFLASRADHATWAPHARAPPIPGRLGST